ncbi:EAL domain-containing protein [Aeromonas enteropelogenes]|uniref:EAL domain-containing protein n=1 Tax=Aeromonas enteropelogenes TaxID=29489 RepID=UPI0038D03F82
MSRFTSVWICLGLLLTPVLLVLLLNPLLTSFVSYHLLKTKSQELLEYQLERNKNLEQNILAQLSHFKFDCGPEDVALLRNPDYYSRHIRLAGLHPSQGGGCSTLGFDLPVLTDVQESDQAATLHFATTQHSANSEPEVLIYSRQAGNLAYWVLNNSWANELLAVPCEDCFYVEFRRDNGAIMEQLLLPRGNKAITQQPNPLSLTDYDEYNKVKQTIWGGNELRYYASQQVYYYGLIFSLLFGLLLVGGYWTLRNYRNSLDGLLKMGLTRGEFIPFYQPIVDSRNNEVVGYEALLRWRRGDTFISPGMFIEYSENQGLILPMTTQMVRQIVEDLKKLPDSHWVSVNLVAAHVEQQTHLQDMLKQLRWPDPDRLTFELTERLPISDVKHAAREMANLGLRGYHFKIDDFGTGYGGFAYLQQLGIRSIKIDKMFIDTIGTSDLKRNVLDAIIAFGHQSKMEMIAEGVENQAQLDYLTEHGVYLIQGYVFAKPMSLDEVLKWRVPDHQGETAEEI